jgi:alkaline phosphatase D
MRFILVFFSFAFFTQWVKAQPNENIIIAFGSCSKQDSPTQLWKDIIFQKPDLWIWGGDNIYGDSPDMNVLKKKYDQQENNPDYQRLLKTCPVTGTWDDHDYGVNDGWKNFNKKDESKNLMLDFLNIDEKHFVRKHAGVYHAFTLSSKSKKIKILNLDTRYFRDSLERKLLPDTKSQDSVLHYMPSQQGDVLGEQQWQWLEDELKNSDAVLNIVNSSIQVISEEHRFEKWANFPSERTRLFNLIKKYPNKKVLIISGDRHIAEFSKLKLDGLPYPLIDFTSSGLTHTWSLGGTEPNVHRDGNLIAQKNYGLLRIEPTNRGLNVIMEVRGSDDQIFETLNVFYQQ